MGQLQVKFYNIDGAFIREVTLNNELQEGKFYHQVTESGQLLPITDNGRLVFPGSEISEAEAVARFKEIWSSDRKEDLTDEQAQEKLYSVMLGQLPYLGKIRT